MIAAADRSVRHSLVRTLTSRLAMTMVAVLLLQAGIVAVRDYIFEIDFLNSYIRREASGIARAYATQTSGSGVFLRASLPAHYNGPHADAYSFRVIEADGRIVAEHNPRLVTGLSLPLDPTSLRQDFWLRRLQPGQRMHVVGGLRVRREGGDLWVEVATLGDPARTYLSSIIRDILDDIWVPAVPLILLTVLVAAISVRRSLRPLIDGANKADEISALERRDRLDTVMLPAEAAHYASAVNRLLDRVADLVGAHRLFMARAAHELRTPISIMMLELKNLKDPNSKRLEADLVAMSGIVDQLLTLSRLMTIEKPRHEPVDVATLALEVVTRMRAWIERQGHSVTISTSDTPPLLGDETAIKEAVRNLIDNAVRHTPPGTLINVEVDQSGTITVEDSGPGLGSQSIEDLQLPFRRGLSASGGAGLGLAIVRQAAELHGGMLEVGVSPLGGARFVVRLPNVRPNLALAA